MRIDISNPTTKQMKFVAQENNRDRVAGVAKETLSLVRGIITHPIVLMVGAFIAIDWANGRPWSDNRADTMLGDMSATALRTGLVASSVIGVIKS